jgi:YD repeat-containing protein
MPTQHGGPVDRFEVDLRYGHFILRQSDLHIGDVFDVPLTRTYNSGDYIHPNRVHAFGKNANHPYDIAPLGTRYPYTYNLIALEDGDFLYFDRVSEGVGFADAIFQHTETSTKFYKAVTTWNGNGWTTWLADGSSIWFPEAYNSTNMAQGASTEMRDAQGNSLKLVRDPQRNLLEIRTPHQHSIEFKYDEQSRIAHAQDDQGTWTQYRYNEDGMLTDVIFSSGHQRHYTYDGILMTTVEDENRKVLILNSYKDGGLIRQDFGDGRVYTYVYRPSQNGVYAESVEVTLPDLTQINVNTTDSVPNHLQNYLH